MNVHEHAIVKHVEPAVRRPRVVPYWMAIVAIVVGSAVSMIGTTAVWRWKASHNANAKPAELGPAHFAGENPDPTRSEFHTGEAQP